MKKSFSFVTATILAAIGGTAMALAQAPMLRVAVPASDASTHDPHRSSASQDKAIAGWMFNGLVRFLPGSADLAKLEPDLAERWDSSPDGLTWTFTLRAGVKFHHGFGEVSADDAVHSLRRAADSKRSSFAADFADIESVEAVDARIVRIRLKRAIPSLLGLVADYHGGMIVSRRADEQPDEGFKRRPVGTGPFAFGEYKPAVSTTLVAHDGYFRGKPKLAGIELRYINSDATRDLALQAGEVDMIAGRREQRWLERMRGTQGLVVDVFPPGEFRTLLINTKKAPLDDVRVRQALFHALDIDALAKFVGADVVLRGNSVVPPGYLGYTDDLPRYPHDVARARQLLADAGHRDGVTIRSVVSNISTQQPIMEVVRAQLQRVGIKLEMNIVDHATYHAQIRQDLSMLTFYGAARFPIADSYLTQFYHSRSAVGQPTASLNFAHCAAADAEIDAARSEPHTAKQMALWASAQRKVMEAVCSVPLYDLLQVWARRSGVDYGYKLEGAMNLAPPITEATSVRR
jgi:peptide/nickel transport system substrate-binding protein